MLCSVPAISQPASTPASASVQAVLVQISKKVYLPAGIQGQDFLEEPLFLTMLEPHLRLRAPTAKEGISGSVCLKLSLKVVNAACICTIIKTEPDLLSLTVPDVEQTT